MVRATNTPSLIALRNALRASHYYDDGSVSDASDFVRCAQLMPKRGSWEMSAVSLSLRGFGASTLDANRAVRDRLRQIAMSQNRTLVLGGVFGKTLWAVHPAGHCLTLDDGIHAVKTRLPADRSPANLHATMWMLSVLSASTRRLLCPSGEAREQWHNLVDNISTADVRILDYLKCFTQPPFFPAVTPPPNASLKNHLDRSFPSLLSEAQFRIDQQCSDPSGLAVLVTDVDDLFLRGLYEAHGKLRIDDRRKTLNLGIGATMLSATGKQSDPLSLLSARVTVSQYLASTLEAIAASVMAVRGNCYFTHGDGVTALIPRSKIAAAQATLSATTTPLPFSWAVVEAGDDIGAAVAVAENRIRHAKMDRIRKDGTSPLTRWRLGKLGIRTAQDEASRESSGITRSF